MKNCLMKNGINIPKSNDALMYLFRLMSEHKDEISRLTLVRILEQD